MYNKTIKKNYTKKKHLMFIVWFWLLNLIRQNYLYVSFSIPPSSLVYKIFFLCIIFFNCFIIHMVPSVNNIINNYEIKIYILSIKLIKFVPAIAVIQWA